MSEVNFQKMKEAVALFLEAAGVSVNANPELQQTPQLVAQAWAEEFLDGYGKDARSPLDQGTPFHPAPDAQIPVVALRDLHFVGVCPHHLIPYEGVAHVAYVPTRFVAGFGAFSQSLDALAHRLALQEDLAQSFGATIFHSGLEPAAVLVRLHANQGCLRLRGENQRSATSVCESFFASERGLNHPLNAYRKCLAETLDR